MTPRELELCTHTLRDASEISRRIDLDPQRNPGTEKAFEPSHVSSKFRERQTEIEFVFARHASYVHRECGEKTFSRVRPRLLRAHALEQGFRNRHFSRGVANLVCLRDRRFEVRQRHRVEPLQATYPEGLVPGSHGVTV